MSLPKHENPKNDIAKAPYNFVPLPETVILLNANDLPDQDMYHPDRLSGYIDCTLKTESPLYIRCPLTVDEFDQGEDEDAQAALPWREQVRNRSDFFYTSDKRRPRIPGSSLRGMLRAIVEIAGYSPITPVMRRRLVYRSIGDPTSHGDMYRNRIMRYDGLAEIDGEESQLHTPLVRAGYITQNEAGDWCIQPAEEHGGVSYARINHGQLEALRIEKPLQTNYVPIFVAVDAYDYRPVKGGFLRIKRARVTRCALTPEPGLLPATLAYSGKMESKRTEAVVFAPKEDANLYVIDDEMELAYREQISQEQRKLLGGSDGVLRNGQPVFYLVEDGKLVFFGHTMMMRLPYPHTPAFFAPNYAREPGKVDFAEALFGYSKKEGEGKARSYASRVFVSDAVLGHGQKDYWLTAGAIAPKILAGPKPTTFQHYLVQKTPDSVEVPRQTGRGSQRRKQLNDYAADASQTALRGHKLYWHKNAVQLRDIQAPPTELREHDTQHTQLRPVKADVEFTFRVWFENLAPVELGGLLWAMTLPGPEEGTYRHSLGMGKPYGMGAVKLSPTLYVQPRGPRYGQLFSKRGDERIGWYTPLQVPDAEQLRKRVSGFERFVCECIGEKEKSRLSDVARIKALFALLSWPGPDPTQTRYLEIEHNDPVANQRRFNEYKSRPVLPNPIYVKALQDLAGSQRQE